MHDLFASLHIIGALSAYLFAFLLFTQRVASARHRFFGIGYAVAMLTAALSGFGIYNWGHPSVFHIFSVITLVSISRGWYAVYQYRWSRDRRHLMNHYFNMAYSFMGINLAAIAQLMRAFSYDSTAQYFTILGVAYLVAITVANRLIQKVYFKRFSGWFHVKPAQ